MVEMHVDDRGLLHHENHYAHPRMRPYERSVHHAARSGNRGLRVAKLLRAVEPGTLTSGQLRAILSDHEGAPESICRHGTQPEDMRTVFWVIADPGRGEVEYGLGPPCSTNPQTYRFE